MNLNEYQKKAMRTNVRKDAKDQIINAALGLSGETGEVADHVKKALFQGHKLDEIYIAKEIGDILWYCAQMADALEIALDEIAEMNIEKLQERYPNGFEVEKSINRKEF